MVCNETNYSILSHHFLMLWSSSIYSPRMISRVRGSCCWNQLIALRDGLPRLMPMIAVITRIRCRPGTIVLRYRHESELMLHMMMPRYRIYLLRWSRRWHLRPQRRPRTPRSGRFSNDSVFVVRTIVPGMKKSVAMPDWPSDSVAVRGQSMMILRRRWNGARRGCDKQACQQYLQGHRVRLFERLVVLITS